MLDIGNGVHAAYTHMPLNATPICPLRSLASDHMQSSISRRYAIDVSPPVGSFMIFSKDLVITNNQYAGSLSSDPARYRTSLPFPY